MHIIPTIINNKLQSYTNMIPKFIWLNTILISSEYRKQLVNLTIKLKVIEEGLMVYVNGSLPTRPQVLMGFAD